MTIEDVVAEAIIRQLMATYTHALDGMRWDELSELFAPDCVVHFPSGSIKGRSFLLSKLSSGRHALVAGQHGGKPLSMMQHHLTSSAIKICGDRASGLSYFLVLSDAGLDHAGTYIDQFVKIEGRWFIAEREATVEWQAHTSLWGQLTSRATKPPIDPRETAPGV